LSTPLEHKSPISSKLRNDVIIVTVGKN